MVRVTGLAPATSCIQNRRSSLSELHSEIKILVRARGFEPPLRRPKRRVRPSYTTPCWSGTMDLHHPSLPSEGSSPLSDSVPVVDREFLLAAHDEPFGSRHIRLEDAELHNFGGRGGIRTLSPFGWRFYRPLSTLSQTCSALP